MMFHCVYNRALPLRVNLTLQIPRHTSLSTDCTWVSYQACWTRWGTALSQMLSVSSASISNIYTRCSSLCQCFLRPTQPSTLSGMENEYWPKCDDALWLGVKAGMVHSSYG